MKTKMKMKNNRMLLALVMVAALAMVSVAGVAVISDEADAANPVTYIDAQTGSISATTGMDYFLATTSGAEIIITDAAYSGTVTIGTFMKTTTAGKTVYTVTSTISSVVFDGATNAIIENTNNAVEVDAVDKMNASVTKGMAIFGADSYFSGKVTSADATFEFSNINGANVEFGMMATLYGNMTTSSVNPLLTFEGTVTISGKSMLDKSDATAITSFGAKINTIIADGANVTIGAPTAIGNAVIAVNGSALYAQATGTDGKVVMGNISKTGEVKFTGLNLNDAYKVIMVSAGATNVYSGTLTFTGSVATYTETMTVSTAITAATVNVSGAAASDKSVGIATTVSPTGLTYWSSTQDIVLLKNLTTLAVTYTALGDAITLSAAPADKDVLFVLMKNKSTGALTAYAGAMTLSTNITALAANTVTGVMAAKDPVAAAADFKTGTVTVNALGVTNVGTMDVKGNLSVSYASNASLTNTGTIDVTGMIQYGVAPAAAPTAPSIGGDVNAAYYFVNTTAQNAVTASTCCYTTLPNAMTKSSDIHIIGVIDIISDMTLTGTSATKNTITVEQGSTLNVGIMANPSAATPVIGKTATVTVPTTTTLTIMVLNGVSVENGKLQFAALKTDTYTNVKAAVFAADATNGTYTDLATAVLMGGETVTLRANADVTAAVVVPSGMTLVAGSFEITVKAGASLTLQGKFTSTGAITVDPMNTNAVAGKLIVDSANIGTLTTGTITINGELTVASGTVITSFSSTAGTGKIIVEGSLTITAASQTALTYVVSGVLNTNQKDTIADTADVTVSGTWKVTGTDTIGKLTVTGKVMYVDTAMLTVTTLVSGSAPTTMKETVNGSQVSVILAASGTATVYGTPAAGKVNIYSSGTTWVTAKTVFYVDSTIVYATEYANGGVVVNLLTPTFEGLKFLAWYENPAFMSAPVTPSTVGNIGEKGSLYASVQVMEFNVTFQYQEGVIWLLDGVVVSGNAIVDFGTHTVTVTAADGYTVKDVKMTMDGKAYSGTAFALKSDAVFSASAASPTKTVDGLSITEILLIVLVVIIALLAIIVVFKMLRS